MGNSGFAGRTAVDQFRSRRAIRPSRGRVRDRSISDVRPPPSHTRHDPAAFDTHITDVAHHGDVVGTTERDLQFWALYLARFAGGFGTISLVVILPKMATDLGVEGVASSFGIRELVWRPGSVIAPVAAGWLMGNVGLNAVFYVGGGFALLGALTFLGVLRRFHGPGALAEW
jgi:hypothetical protein